jgi:periplasmic protein TonB
MVTIRVMSAVPSLIGRGEHDPARCRLMATSRRCKLRTASSATMDMIRQHVAPWTIPVVFTSVLHLGLAWGAVGLDLGNAPRPLPEFAIDLLTLSPELPESVVPPPPRALPAPKPPRPEPVRTAAARVPAEPVRPIESTATTKPPATMVEEVPVAVEPKTPESRASAPPVVEAPGVTERSSPADKQTPASAPETVALPADGTPGPAARARASSDAPSALTTAPAAPQTAAIPPNASGSDVTRIARPRGGYQVLPTYPSTARRLGIQGTALLRVLVLDDGRVGEIQVQRSAGHPDLDRAASAAVHRWRFDPARKGSEPVSTWVLLPVEFRLTE